MRARKATQNDIQSIYGLNKLISPDEEFSFFESVFSKFNGIFVVIENDAEEIVGFSSLSFPYWAGIGLILHFSVLPGFQSKGIGSLLMKFIKEEANKNRLRFLTVRTAEWNNRGIHFYEKNGFSKRFVFQDYFGDNNPMVWLDFDLRNKI